MARLTTKARETSFSGATVEVTEHHGVDEPAPAPIGPLEPLFPKGLHLLVVGLEEPIQRGFPRIPGLVEAGIGRRGGW